MAAEGAQVRDIQLPWANGQIEAARRAFLDKHPNNKHKDQSRLAKGDGERALPDLDEVCPKRNRGEGFQADWPGPRVAVRHFAVATNCASASVTHIMRQSLRLNAKRHVLSFSEAGSLSKKGVLSWLLVVIPAGDLLGWRDTPRADCVCQALVTWFELVLQAMAPLPSPLPLTRATRVWKRWRPCCCTRASQLLPKLLLSQQGRPLEVQVTRPYMQLRHTAGCGCPNSLSPYIPTLLSIVV